MGRKRLAVVRCLTSEGICGEKKGMESQQVVCSLLAADPRERDCRDSNAVDYACAKWDPCDASRVVTVDTKGVIRREEIRGGLLPRSDEHRACEAFRIEHIIPGQVRAPRSPSGRPQLHVATSHL